MEEPTEEPTEESTEESTEEPKEESKPAVGGKKKHFSIKIDPRGDVTLEVGSPAAKRSLRVSSSALSLGSPVFAAMLNSAFIEGIVPTDGSTRTISLQEDNPRAVTTLCNVLHHQTQYVRVEKFKDLDQLALLCDKYDCARALKPWTTLWLQRWRGSESGEDDYWKMLYITYALDDRAAFYAASLGILQHYDEEKMTGASATWRGLAILPDSVIDGLQARRREIVEKVHQQIENVVASYMEDASSKISIRVTREGDCFSTAKIGSYFLELSRLGLWPLTETLRKCSVEQILSKLSCFENYTFETLKPNRNVTLCDCNTCAADFEEDLQSVVTQKRNSLRGLCLSCAAAERTSAATGNCQRETWCCGPGNFMRIPSWSPPLDCEYIPVDTVDEI